MSSTKYGVASLYSCEYGGPMASGLVSEWSDINRAWVKAHLATERAIGLSRRLEREYAKGER